MLDLKVVDKEIVPLVLKLETKILTLQLNQNPTINKRGMWPNETLEATMDVVEKMTYYFKMPSRSWNIPLSLITFYSSKCQNKIQKDGNRRCAYKRRR